MVFDQVDSSPCNIINRVCRDIDACLSSGMPGAIFCNSNFKLMVDGDCQPPTPRLGKKKVLEKQPAGSRRVKSAAHGHGATGLPTAGVTFLCGVFRALILRRLDGLP